MSAPGPGAAKTLCKVAREWNKVKLALVIDDYLTVRHNIAQGFMGQVFALHNSSTMLSSWLDTALLGFVVDL